MAHSAYLYTVYRGSIQNGDFYSPPPKNSSYIAFKHFAPFPSQCSASVAPKRGNRHVNDRHEWELGLHHEAPMKG